MALTGAVAQNGKQLAIALELWRDDVNAHGGLLGRPASWRTTTTRAIRPTCRALHQADHRRQSRPIARPLRHQHGRARGAGDHGAQHDDDEQSGDRREPAFPLLALLRHDPGRPGRHQAFPRGFFELAAAQKPKPQTVAILAADAEFSKTSADGARANAPGPRVSRSSTIRAIRRAPPITHRWCARCRRPFPMRCSSPPIHPTPSASRAPWPRWG